MTLPLHDNITVWNVLFVCYHISLRIVCYSQQKVSNLIENTISGRLFNILIISLCQLQEYIGTISESCRTLDLMTFRALHLCIDLRNVEIASMSVSLVKEVAWFAMLSNVAVYICFRHTCAALLLKGDVTFNQVSTV